MSKTYFGIDLENLPTSLKILHLQPEFGIFLIQKEKIIYANKRFQELFDVTEEELVHFDIFKLRDQIVHSGDMETVKQHYSEQIKASTESTPSKYEYRIVTKNNETRWISFYIINIEYEKIPGILGFTLDITAQKTIEEQYKLLSIAAERSNDAIMICDDIGKILYSNKMGEKFSQMTHEELLKMNSMEFTPPDDVEHNNRKIQQLMTEGSIVAWETRMLRKDKTILPIEITSTILKNSEGKVSGSITISRDISERKKLEENIKRLSLAVEISTDAIIITNREGRIAYCNSAASHFYGVPKDQLINQSSLSYSHPSDQIEIRNKMEELFQLGRISSWESRIVRKDQTILPIEISMTLLKSGNGDLEGAISIIRDISERKMFEEERLRSQRLDSLSTLAGGIAHDFNNLLAGILGNIQLMQISAHLDIENEEYLKEMEKATLRAKNLTHQLVTFSKGGNPIQKPESIQDI